MNLDAGKSPFPADVKKVMLGETPTNSNMYLSENVDNITGTDKSIRDMLKSFTKSRD